MSVDIALAREALERLSDALYVLGEDTDNENGHYMAQDVVTAFKAVYEVLAALVVKDGTEMPG